MSDAEFYWHLLRGVVLTMVNRARRQIIIVPLDPERLSSERQVKPRKPPSERKPVPNNPDRKLQSTSVWPTGRKLQSRKRETT